MAVAVAVVKRPKSKETNISIGSYGTRNVIEVMESWFWERPTDCLALKLMMSLMMI